eukprot:1325458-Prymnesium_polylepis.1
MDPSELSSSKLKMLSTTVSGYAARPDRCMRSSSSEIAPSPFVSMLLKIRSASSWMRAITPSEVAAAIRMLLSYRRCCVVNRNCGRSANGTAAAAQTAETHIVRRREAQKTALSCKTPKSAPRPEQA